MSAAASKMPPRSSALESIYLFGLGDILLKTKLGMKILQRSNLQEQSGGVEVGVEVEPEQLEVDKKYWKLRDQTDSAKLHS